MIGFAQLSFGWVLVLFAITAAVVGFAGTRIARLADVIADASGMGEAVIGSVFLGGATSLSGLVTSVTAGLEGRPTLAVSNAIGGILVQTAFLAVADITYRGANLEHAAASLTNVTTGGLLIVLLTIPAVASTAPSFTVLGVHPATPLMFAAYAYGLRIAGRADRQQMWKPRTTSATRLDEPKHAREHGWSLARMWLRFAGYASVLGFSGWMIAQLGVQIAVRTGLSETAVGSLLTATSTSLPEFVTVIATVRTGALTLAVADIIGGNTFDTLIVALSDIAYRDGSIYDVFRAPEAFMFSMGGLMTAVLVTGMLIRERKGPGGIGFESAVVLALYGLSVAILLILG